MSIYKCKICGGNLEVTSGETIATCEYCGTMQTLPRVGEESITNLFNRANRLRMHCEFDKAEELYEKIINFDDTESEAHWGMILCKYGIEYVEDPNTFERIPTCHRTSFESVITDNDYLAAIEHADPNRRKLYEEEAIQIDNLQKNVLQIVKNEKPFDVFICYKENDENGERTTDSVIGQEIYEHLTEKGYRVFFSHITLEDKLGIAYEPYIFAALNSAKVMLVIGTKPEYLDAVWVRNEWSRYLKLMKKDHSKLLIPCYKDMDPYDLPEAFSHLQAQNLMKIGAVQDLIRGIGKIVKSDQDATKVYTNSVNNNALIDNAMSFLKDGNFSSAETTIDMVLKTDPENGLAYVGKLMAELKIKEFSLKKFFWKKYRKNKNYAKAKEFGDTFVQEKLENIDRMVKVVKKRIIIASLAAVSLFLAVCLSIFVAFEIKYNNAIEKFLAASTNGEYAQAAKEFDSLKGYKYSESYAAFSRSDSGANQVFYEITEIEIPKIKEDLYIFYYIKESFPNLKTVHIKEGVERIPANIFQNCGNLEKVEISEGVKTIGQSAFSGCSSLTTITIPKSVTTIENSAFFSCSGLTNLTISEGVETIERYAFSCCSGLTTVTIPKSVTTIENSAFLSCSSLTNLTISEGVETIGQSAFSGCSGLTTVTIPKSVTTIENSAFLSCSGLTNLTISEGVETIGRYVFASTNIESITIPVSVTTIEINAFANCRKLENIYYKGSEADREKIIINDSSITSDDVTWHYNSKKELLQ